MPQLLDPNFQRAVVLMIEHSEKGSMGLIINRPAKLNLKDVGASQELSVARKRQGESLFLGGPVESYRGFVLHDAVAVEERAEVLPGLFLSMTSPSLEFLLNSETGKMRFCLGYAGWGPGQVEQELKAGTWLFSEASALRVLSSDPSTVWEEVIQSMGIDPSMLVTTGGVN